MVSLLDKLPVMEGVRPRKPSAAIQGSIAFDLRLEKSIESIMQEISSQLEDSRRYAARLLGYFSTQTLRGSRSQVSVDTGTMKNSFYWSLPPQSRATARIIFSNTAYNKSSQFFYPARVERQTQGVVRTLVTNKNHLVESVNSALTVHAARTRSDRKAWSQSALKYELEYSASGAVSTDYSLLGAQRRTIAEAMSRQMGGLPQPTARPHKKKVKQRKGVKPIGPKTPEPSKNSRRIRISSKPTNRAARLRAAGDSTSTLLRARELGMRHSEYLDLFGGD